MKLNYLYTSFGILLLLLAGCGTSLQNQGEESNGSTTQKEEKIDEESSKEQSTKEENSTSKDETDNSDTRIRLMENNLVYSIDGQSKEETAFLKHSNNQGYSLYILPDYELTAEEPNKDVVILKSDGDIFMRIELFPSSVEWSQMETTAIEQLKAVSPDVKEIKVPEREFFLDSKAYETMLNGDIVTAYLIKNSEGLIKLTTFTKENVDHRDPFLVMAETIINEAK